MEWSSEQKQCVKSLLAVVVQQEHRYHAWIWMVQSIPLIEQRLSTYWDTCQIGQALLLAQTSLWPIDVWRSNVTSIRDWQQTHCEAITRRNRPQALYELCQSLNWSCKYVKSFACAD
jgi:hypothetical protein